MPVVEVTTFRIVGGEEAFLDADRRVQSEFFYQQPGLVRRTTARAADGEWLVIAVWRSADDTAAAAARAEADPTAHAFLGSIERSSTSTKRYETLD